MGDRSTIEWTDATWNPVTGCTKVTRGCDNCYAERFAERFRGTLGHHFESGFDLTLRPERLSQPLRWKRPRMIFVNSMSDLFHKDIPKDFIDRVFDTMEAADRHVFQVLTKRSSLMGELPAASIRVKTHPSPYLVWRFRGRRHGNRQGTTPSESSGLGSFSFRRTAAGSGGRYGY